MIWDAPRPNNSKGWVVAVSTFGAQQRAVGAVAFDELSPQAVGARRMPALPVGLGPFEPNRGPRVALGLSEGAWLGTTVGRHHK